MEFLHPITNTPLGVALSLCAAGYVAYVAYQKQRNTQEDRLMQILEKTVSALQEKVSGLEVANKMLEERVEELETTNKKYVEILENRDRQTVEFMERASDSMEKVDRMHQGLTELIDLLTGHLKVIGCPHGITDEGKEVVK